MKNLIYLILTIITLNVFGQEQPNIVKIIDNLTVQWDQSAIELKDYQGIQNFCARTEYKQEIIDLLDDIHHWDTTLYFIVQEKYANSEDKEAIETLKDIEKLETEYSTENFKHFITDECSQLKVIEEGFDEKTIKQYTKDIRSFEKEQSKYINSITYRIDIIDEHIHHLKLD